MDVHIFYTLLSAVVGGVMGARGRLGEVSLLSLLYQLLILYLIEAFVHECDVLKNVWLTCNEKNK